jgi:hypothetical protein
MQNQIKDIIDTKYTEKVWHGVGVDEEQQLISFKPEDLAAVIKAVLLVAADLCVFQEDSMRITNYSKGI